MAVVILKSKTASQSELLVKRVSRNEQGKLVEFFINENDKTIKILSDKPHQTELIVSQNRFKTECQFLFDTLKTNNQKAPAFSIPQTEAFLSSIGIHTLKAPSSDKTDIQIQIHDPITGENPILGFSIKSDLGSAPTLLNASKATSFIYQVHGITTEQAKEINQIDTRNKMCDRMKRVSEYSGHIYPHSVEDPIFNKNLILIDDALPLILQYALLYYYRNHNQVTCNSIIEKMEEDDPLNRQIKNYYKLKFSRFLYNIALGWTPRKQEWNGEEEANGGYIVVDKKGDVKAIHGSSKSMFQNYLLDNTKFDTPSTSRHNFGTIEQKK